ncbi:BTB/POZ domain-containing protein [Rhizophagus irregularis DAOM 181602=DAOM 197198]|nr:BTB/POZ domain-containing protein [Rhizophagus irregularis DAOM 181602=DAOM 197198]
MSRNFESEISKAFEQLLKNETDYNVIIYIGEEPNIKEFHAHHIILRCRSEYFNKILSDENIKKKDGNYIIENSNIDPQSFKSILKYLYTGHINITNKNETELLNILIASDELKLKRLTKLTEEFIIEKHHQFLQNDPVGILQTVYYQIILKRDDLNLSEIEIWENLIKWGLSQEQEFNQEIFQWNQDDINIFKGILQKFIPLIRFYEISSEDYYNKVKPYEGILSKELIDEILKFHMVPGYRRTLNIYGPRHSNYGIINNIRYDIIIIYLILRQLIVKLLNHPRSHINYSIIFITIRIYINYEISSFFSKMKYYQAIIDIINFIIFDDEINPISPLELPPPKLPSPHLVLYILLLILLILDYFDGVIVFKTLYSIWACFFYHRIIAR